MRKIQSIFLLLPMAFTLSAVLSAQDVVTIDATKPINVLTRTSFGLSPQVGDTTLGDAALPQLLLPAGLRAIRYPDGWDGQADLYHWSTYRANKWGNSNPPKTAYYPPQNDFGHFALQLDKIGTAIITVNYGSNMAGNGPGDAVEAAAWVAYANGDPASALALGKDKSGFDWNTVGYWASMRASAPLAEDDGYNFLRIHHTAPFRIQLWEVGNQVYNNGYYGDDHAGETDWHESYSDGAKRHKSANLSPAAYAANFAQFAVAMKAVDPTILVGASMTLPKVDAVWAADWDTVVLKDACSKIDFASFGWTPGGVVLPPDWKHLDEADLLKRPETDLPDAVNELLYLYKKNCPADHTPKFAITQMGIQNWPIIDDVQVPALFAADAYALLAEMGSIANDWANLHDKGLLTDDSKPLPVYFGLQMLHIVAFQPGDQFLSVKAAGGVAVHATHRHDGVFGVMLINKNSHETQNVKVVLSGAKLKPAGLRFDYGSEQAKKNNGPTKNDLQINGNEVVVSIPPYSIVDLLLPEAK